jgi:hypothetical protein
VSALRTRNGATRKFVTILGYRSSWALNSAVECHLHTSSLSNTFNLTRLLGTAKYLKTRSSQNNNGGSNGGYRGRLISTNASHSQTTPKIHPSIAAS